MRHILVVDDDPHIREVIRFALEKEGMRVSEAGDGASGLSLLARERADAVVLDILMPEMDGLEVCRILRRESDVPVLFLSSKDDEIDKVVGLEIGGDDYLTKPFSPRELVARINAVLRRTGREPAARPAQEATRLEHGLLELDTEAHVCRYGEREIELTATEFMLLSVMMARPNMVHTRDKLMDLAYDGQVEVSSRTIDSHIRGVRTKLAGAGLDQAVVTVHGVGYRLGECR